MQRRMVIFPECPDAFCSLLVQPSFSDGWGSYVYIVDVRGDLFYRYQRDGMIETSGHYWAKPSLFVVM